MCLWLRLEKGSQSASYFSGLFRSRERGRSDGPSTGELGVGVDIGRREGVGLDSGRREEEGFVVGVSLYNMRREEEGAVVGVSLDGGRRTLAM
ncbi:uncharacterized protein A4U43_C07F11990 [Asparagus officinalis]|uniref:Uncharacterized protein n=1 Tax=Asparagus officinalis TaxID=4686 RepID=A0A5P1EB96_ASPOF|nr:uncharacterized protein A4U43_C07F11990 [Asparagus officinalis]